MKTKLITKPIELHYRRNDEYIRVWRNDWAGDMFETLTKQQFECVDYVCRRFSIKLVEAED